MTTAVLDTGVKSLLARSGAMRILDRIGVKEPLGRLWRLALNPRSVRENVDLFFDYRDWRRRCRSLAGNVPFSGPARRALVADLGVTPVGFMKAEAMLAKALQLRGVASTIVTQRSAAWKLRYFRAIGLDAFDYFDDDGKREPSPAVSAEAVDLLGQAATRAEVEALEFRGVHIGRQTLNTLSMDLRKGRLDPADPATREQIARYLARAMDAVNASDRLLDRLRPDLLLLGEKGYLPFGPLFETAINRGIPAITWNASQRSDALVLKRFSKGNSSGHYFTLSPETWAVARRMPWTGDRQRDLDEEIARHYAEGIRFQGEPLQAGKNLKSPAEVTRLLGLDPSKKTAVVFSHVLWDGTLSYGSNLFYDYEEWLVQTVKAACANPGVNWVIKFHPANLWKSRQTGHRGELWDRVAIRQAIGALPGHVKLMDPSTEINTFSLFDVADYCLTVRGTIGIEMPCYGIPVVTGGSGRCSGLGFTEDSSTAREYLDKLASIQALPRLSPARAELAKKHAYALFLGRPWRFSSFEVGYMSLSKAGHPLNPNVTLRVKSLAELISAPDLVAFADWAADSTDADFMALPLTGGDAAPHTQIPFPDTSVPVPSSS